MPRGRFVRFALSLLLAGAVSSCVGPCAAPLIPFVNWPPAQPLPQEPPEVTKYRIDRFYQLTPEMTLDAVVGRCGQPDQKIKGHPTEWLYSLGDHSTVVVGAGPTGKLVHVYRITADGNHDFVFCEH